MRKRSHDLGLRTSYDVWGQAEQLAAQPAGMRIEQGCNFVLWQVATLDCLSPRAGLLTC